MLKYLFFILLAITLLLPFSVSAQEFALPKFPIVPCGQRQDDPDTPDIHENQKCTLCHFFVMAKNIIDLLLAFIILIAPVFIAIGGLTILLAAGKPDRIDRGKRIISSAIIGVVIALISWTVLGMLFNALVGTDGLFPWPWYAFDCPVT
jgi:hypothetical protein